jgi:hypothetical protein
MEAEGHVSPWLANLLRLSLICGLRPGEVRTLKWSSVNLPRNKMVVAGKTGTREIHLTDGAVSVLSATPKVQECEYVFAGPRFGKFQTLWYDLDAAQHNCDSLDTGIPNVAPVLINRFKMFNQQEAQVRNEANKAENNAYAAGGGTIVINGEPNAMSGSTATVVGARQGIDGDYRIETATHILSRSESAGYITELQVVEPAAGGAKQPSPDPPFQYEAPSSTPQGQAPQPSSTPSTQ